MTFFKVYSGWFGINKTQIIEANSYKEAAIKYCDKFPIKKDFGIWVVEKGFRNRKNRMLYTTSELIPEQIKIRTGNKDFDESKIGSHSLKLLDIIKKNNPDWLNNIFNCEVSQYKSKSGFIINILNPYQDYHPIEISIEDGDGSILSFAVSWADWYELRDYSDVTWSEWNKNNPESVYKAILKLVTEIVEEKLISCNARYTKGLGSVNGLFLTKEEYNLTKEQESLLQAISWRGTFNYAKYE